MEPLITFIIPTIGRSTLTKSIESLKKLNFKNWRAVVVFDGIEPNIKEYDNRIKIVKLNKKVGQGRNSAGNVRNYGYNFVNTEWVGFLDDDDTLNPYYIDYLYNDLLQDDIDVLIFRMIYNCGKILPMPEDNDFKINEVGISFCLKTELAKKFLFIPSGTEDFELLDRLRSNGYNIVISDYIGYNVNPNDKYRGGIYKYSDRIYNDIYKYNLITKVLLGFILILLIAYIIYLNTNRHKR